MKNRESKKVSVIIPVYNSERYLRVCMDSVISQTYKNLEIICVDDGSTDTSRDILLEYQAKDDRISVLSQKNLYAGVARNAGFEICTGDYCIFLDSDDIFDPLMIEKLLNKAIAENTDIVICKGEGLDDETGMKHRLFAKEIDIDAELSKRVFSVADIPESIFQITDTWVWDQLYKVDFIREKNIRFQNTKGINDALFCCLAYAEARRIAIVDEYLVTHRTGIHASVEAARASYWKSAYFMLDRLKEELEARNIYQTVGRSYINLVAEKIIYYVMTISDPASFHDAFVFYQNTAKERYHLMDYEEEFFHDKAVYKKIKLLEDCDEISYLCYLRSEEKSRFMECGRIIWYLDKEVERINVQMNNMIDWLNKAKRWRFPISALPTGSRIILYGFGDLGHDYYDEILDAGINLVGVADKNYMNLDVSKIKYAVFPPKDIIRYEYDYIILAVAKEMVANEIKNDLKHLGVPCEKILWFDPIAGR